MHLLRRPPPSVPPSASRRTFLAGVGWLAAPASWADCPDIRGAADVHIVGNAFPVVQHVARWMERCNRPDLKVTVKLTPLAREETERAFASSRPPFDAALVSMGQYSRLYSLGQLETMTDLVEKYRERWRIEERMLVRVDGEVMAIAYQQNAQNLFYRKDLLARHGLAVPTTYDELLQAAAVLQAREPGMGAPLAQTFAKGFDGSTEFANLLAGFNGRFFRPGTAEPAFNDPAGVQAIELMKRMTRYMTPNYLSSNSDDVMNQFQQGRAALGVLWASRAARMDDPAASKVVGLMDFAPAPAARPGGPSAAHLWWDGVVMPRALHKDRVRRDIVFQILMEGLSEESTRSGNDVAIWVRSAYRPTRFGAGVLRAVEMGAPIWPSQPFFGLAHAEIGKVLPQALSGDVAPQQALDAAAAAYRQVAMQKGFIQ